MKRWFILLFLLLVSSVVVEAQTFAITVNPVWRPSLQLDSAFPNDIRYVDVEINIISNVQIWAVSGSCTVNKAVLQGYVQDLTSSTADPGDNIAPVRWNPALWGVLDADYTAIPPAFNATTGVMTFTASRLEPVAPIGYNGRTDTMTLATLRFQVKDLTIAATSTLVCTVEFLDRNGRKVVAAPVVKAPAALSVITGYSIKGNVKYQAHTVQTGIAVSCTGPASGTAATDALGNFAINNLRAYGVYTCTFTGGVGLAARYLTAQTSVDVSQFAFNPPTIPEIQLKAGNNTGLDTVINGLDLTNVTASFGLAVTKDTSGDANGDAKVNQSDLAIVASNLFRAGPADARHLIYSISRNSSIQNDGNPWLGIVDSNSVSQLLATQKKVYWSQLSPDGTKLAYVQEVTPFNAVTGALPRYALFTAPLAAGAAVRLTPVGWNMDAFAPSWSPDGGKIAFVCSKNTVVNADWYGNGDDGFGNLCVIDAVGTSLVINSSFTEIRTPAWFDNTRVIYPAALDPLLWQYDVAAGTEQSLSNITNATSPVFEDGVLFYESGANINAASYDGNPAGVSTLGDITFPGYNFATTIPAFYGFDVSEHLLSVVVDDGAGGYTVYAQTNNLATQIPAFTSSDSIQVDSAVSAPYSGDHSYGWALRNSVDFAW